MPTTYRRSRRPLRRRAYRKKKTVAKPIVRYVKRAIGKSQEMKCYWNTFSEVAINSIVPTSFYDSLAGISQNAYSYGRVGTEITAKGLQIKGQLHNNNASETMYCRMVCMWYYGGTETFDNTAEMFVSTSDARQSLSALYGTNSIWWPIAKRHGYKVLFDLKFKLGASVSGADGSNTKMVNKFIKLNKKIRYNSTGSTGVYNTPRLLLGMWSGEADNDESVGSNIEFTGFSRLFYQDA